MDSIRPDHDTSNVGFTTCSDDRDTRSTIFNTLDPLRSKHFRFVLDFLIEGFDQHLSIEKVDTITVAGDTVS